jgi:dsRNA-specific ribonuclease
MDFTLRGSKDSKESKISMEFNQAEYYESSDRDSLRQIGVEIDKLFKTSEIKFNVSVCVSQGRIGNQISAFSENASYDSILCYADNEKQKDYISTKVKSDKLIFARPLKPFTGMPNELSGWVCFIDMTTSPNTESPLISGYTIEEILGMNMATAMFATKSYKSYPISEFSNMTEISKKIGITKFMISSIQSAYDYKVVQLTDGSYLNLYINKKQFENLKNRYNGLLRKFVGAGMPPTNVSAVKNFYPYPNIESNRTFLSPQAPVTKEEKEKVFEGITTFEELLKADSAAYRYSELKYPVLNINTNIPATIDRTKLDKFIKMTPTLGSKLAYSWIENQKDEKLWEDSLKHYVAWILSPIQTDAESLQKIVEEYTSPSAMKMWKKTFTAYSYDPNENYESVEYHGDRSLALIHGSYIAAKFPQYNKPGMLSSFEHTYMSGPAHEKYCIQLQLDKFVRVGAYDRVNDVVRKNLFEALFGALRMIGNTSKFPTRGDYISKAIFGYMFKDYVPEEIFGFGAVGNQANEMFSRLGLGKVEPESVINKNAKNPDEKFIATIKISDKAKNIFLKYGIDISKASNIIGYGYGSSKRQAEGNAYYNMMKYLWSIGANRTWLMKTKSAMEMESDIMREYKPYYDEYAKRNFIDYLYIDMPQKYIIKNPDGSIKLIRGILTGYKRDGVLMRDITEVGRSYDDVKRKIGERVKNLVKK